MVSVEDALKKIAEFVQVGSEINMPISESMGMILSRDVSSPIDMPPFDQSAMDGYAVRFDGNSTFRLLGEIKAGDNLEPILKPGEAVRIFTGAPVPKSADAVIRQEDIRNTATEIEANPIPKAGANVRPKGEQILMGDIALKKGHRISPASIGFLSGLGISNVKVFAYPKVAILITGNELVKPGSSLEYGQIFESNSSMLVNACRAHGLSQVEVLYVKDNYQSTLDQLNIILSNYELVICSGGISVGDYDYVGKALSELGVTEVFYKVKQKPGKPLFFGTKGNCHVFALPGNPAAALTCFYVYVLLALEIMTSGGVRSLKKEKKRVTSDLIRKGDRALFLKATHCNGDVQVLEGQSSAMLHTFARCNALIYISLDEASVKKGEEVNCYLLNE